MLGSWWSTWWCIALAAHAGVAAAECDVDFREWPTSRVAMFVAGIIHEEGVEQPSNETAQAFLRNRIDGSLLAILSDGDLESLGIYDRMSRLRIRAFVDHSRNGCQRKILSSRVPGNDGSQGISIDLNLLESSQKSIGKLSEEEKTSASDVSGLAAVKKSLSAASASGSAQGPGKPLKKRRLADNTSGAQRDLINTLLEDYNIRATPNDSGNTTVEVGINFYAVDDINVAASEATINIWFRSMWNDPRLAWDPSDFGGVTQIALAADPVSIEQSMIWAPDIELLNAIGGAGLSDFTPKDAMVYSDGTVFWSRSGSLGIICNYEGLEKFPYDNLSCEASFSGWAHSGNKVDYVLLDGGISVDEFAEIEFVEFHFDQITVKQEHVYYPCCPGEKWPHLHYNLHFARASSFYTREFVVPLIVCVFLNFAVFCMDAQGGERLGYSVTMLLTIVAMQLLVQDHIPVSDTITWYSRMTLSSQLFVVLTMAETVCVQNIFYRNMRCYERYHYRLRRFERWLGQVLPDSCCCKPTMAKSLKRRQTLIRNASAKQKQSLLVVRMLTSIRSRAMIKEIRNRKNRRNRAMVKTQCDVEMALATETIVHSGGRKMATKTDSAAVVAMERDDGGKQQQQQQQKKNASQAHSDIMKQISDMSDKQLHEDVQLNEDTVLNWAALRIQSLYRAKKLRQLETRLKRRIKWLNEHGLTEAQYYLARQIDMLALILFPLCYALTIASLYIDI